MTGGTVWPPTAKGVAAAVAALRRGAVIAFPTDTVFGLAALASDPEAVRRIAVIKGRPPEQPLILMAAGPEEMAPFAELGTIGIGLAGRFWPGPLTLIVPARPPAAPLGGGRTVGVRVPAHPLALALLSAAGPLATTSANLHGRPPVPDAASAVAELKGLGGALAAPEGPRPPAQPSSILDLTRGAPVLLRRGRLGPGELALPGLEDPSGARRE